MRLQILATLLTLPLASCSRVVAHANITPPEGLPVRVSQAALENVPVEIPAVGNVEAIESVEVKPRVGGQIRSVAFVEGQEVAKGQLLFSVDRDTLNRELAQQQAELDRDMAMEQQAAAVVARDAASEKQRHSEADIALRLGELGVLSGQAVSQAVSTNEAAHAGFRPTMHRRQLLLVW
jgi:multidrug efflux pump subunit AcrA (membrane-fusion protein)